MQAALGLSKRSTSFGGKTKYLKKVIDFYCTCITEMDFYRNKQKFDMPWEKCSLIRDNVKTKLMLMCNLDCKLENTLVNMELFSKF